MNLELFAKLYLKFNKLLQMYKVLIKQAGIIAGTGFHIMKKPN